MTLLEGERVRLREFVIEDASAICAYGADDDVIRYLDWGPTRSVEEAEQFIEGVQRQYRDGTGLVLAVVERESSEVVGNIALMAIDSVRRQAELGYVLSRRCWGRGYITEAARLLLRNAFTERRFREIVAYVDPTNERSRRVLLRIGMRREPGMHWYTIRGEPILHERYVLRREEFRWPES